MIFQLLQRPELSLHVPQAGVGGIEKLRPEVFVLQGLLFPGLPIGEAHFQIVFVCQTALLPANILEGGAFPLFDLFPVNLVLLLRRQVRAQESAPVSVVFNHVLGAGAGKFHLQHVGAFLLPLGAQRVVEGHRPVLDAVLLHGVDLVINLLPEDLLDCCAVVLGDVVVGLPSVGMEGGVSLGLRLLGRLLQEGVLGSFPDLRVPGLLLLPGQVRGAEALAQGGFPDIGAVELADQDRRGGAVEEDVVKVYEEPGCRSAPAGRRGGRPAGCAPGASRRSRRPGSAGRPARRRRRSPWSSWKAA